MVSAHNNNPDFDVNAFDAHGHLTQLFSGFPTSLYGGGDPNVSPEDELLSTYKENHSLHSAIGRWQNAFDRLGEEIEAIDLNSPTAAYDMRAIVRKYVYPNDEF